MKKTADFLYRLAVNAAAWLGILLTGLLFLSAFLVTCYAQDMESQLVLTKWDFIPLSLAGGALFLLAARGVFGFVEKKPEQRKRILLVCVLGWYLFMGGVLILFGKTGPSADSMSVYSAAQQLALGNTGVIHPDDSYLSYYPQQLGLTAYYEAVIRLLNLLHVGLAPFHFIKCINVLWACLTVWLMYRTAGFLFPQKGADTVCLILLFVNAPFIMYTSFVYGEVPSFALFALGLYCLLLLCGRPGPNHSGEEQKKGGRGILLGVLSVASFAASVALRKNALIFMIAVIAVTLFEALRRRKVLLLVLALGYVCASCFTLPCIQTYYEHRAHNWLREGVTPLSYLAMGMQESSRADGWYNGFNFETYRDAGMDAAVANEVSRRAIEERLSYFAENPGYALRFYRNKFSSQWCDGTYASRQATLATFGGRSSFFEQLYEGKYSGIYIGFCNQIQNILYLGAFLFCLFSLKKRRSAGLLPFLFVIGVLGGFLFHMLWEANARYIFPYSLLLVYCASSGLAEVFESRAGISYRKIS